MKLDMTQAPDGAAEPGVYLARVASVDAKQSRSGDDMLNLKLVKDHGRKQLCYDNIMLGGPGWSIGYPKLVALGVSPDHSGEFDPQSLHGRRVWVEVHRTEYDGKQKLEVNIDALSHKGYQPITDTPSGQEPAGEDDSDTPF